MTDSAPAARVAGVGILTADPATHHRLLADALGYEVQAVGEIDVATAARLRTTPGGTWTVYGTPWTTTGRIAVFAPATPGPSAAREDAAPHDVDAIKVLDVPVRDGQAMIERLEACGATIPGTLARYPIAPGHGEVVERHAEAPDGIRIALLEFHDEPRSDWCHAPDDAETGELLAVSLPVQDIEPATSFVADRLGLPLDHEFRITEPAMREVAGVGPGGALIMRTFAPSTRDTALAVVDYGKPPGTQRSLAEQAAPPHRGAVILTLEVADLAERCEALRRAGDHPSDIEVVDHPFGTRALATVISPQGVLIELLAPITTPDPASGP